MVPPLTECGTRHGERPLPRACALCRFCRPLAAYLILIVIPRALVGAALRYQQSQVGVVLFNQPLGRGPDATHAALGLLPLPRSLGLLPHSEYQFQHKAAQLRQVSRAQTGAYTSRGWPIWDTVQGPRR